MRDEFNKSLNELINELLIMSSYCEKILTLLGEEIEDQKDRYDAITEISALISESETRVESLCLELILRQQPVARDFRIISVALKIVTDIGRVGEQVEDIAEIIQRDQLIYSHYQDKLVLMLDKVKVMIEKSTQCWIEQDIELAREVVMADDEVDDLFEEVKEEVARDIPENKTNPEIFVDVLMIAKYFERIGDHAVNIAERILSSLVVK